jgi:hypothetical protein
VRASNSAIVTPSLHVGVRYEVQLIPQPEKANTATPLTALYTSTINTTRTFSRRASA